MKRRHAHGRGLGQLLHPERGRPDLREVFLDGTSVRAQHKAAGAKGGMPARPWPLARRLGLQGVHGVRPLRPARAFTVIPGKASEFRTAPDLVAKVTAVGRPGRVVCNRGYSAERWRASIRAAGAEPVVPAQPTHRNAPRHDPEPYRRRHRVENLSARLTGWRALATRYDKTAESFLGGLYLAAALDWLSNGPKGPPMRERADGRRMGRSFRRTCPAVRRSSSWRPPCRGCRRHRCPARAGRLQA
ncbi:transposase [Arenibaculum pallidiluteum]|uniref:transposase n=1 Tax=Arenibaculum pallidiluteum TaxID=2812559 RepID=UPI001A97BCA3